MNGSPPCCTTSMSNYWGRPTAGRGRGLGGCGRGDLGGTAKDWSANSWTYTTGSTGVLPGAAVTAGVYT